MILYILLKFTLKNFKEKKMRTFLIIFSIMASAALLFATGSITKTMVKIYSDQIKKNFGNTEIVVQTNSKSPGEYFSPTGAEKYIKSMDYIVQIVKSNAFYRNGKNETVLMDLQGASLKDMDLINPIVLAQESNLYPFEGRKIIISRMTSEKYNLKLGSTLDMEINGNVHRFKVCGISQQVGYFTGEIEMVLGIVPKDTLSSICSQRGQVSSLYIKLKNPDNKQDILKKLSIEYKQYNVRETITDADLNEQTKSMASSLSLASLVVLFIAVFIIYTSFKVITIERLPVIGTFRSIGATKKMTNLILVIESCIYGIIGGIFGGVLGIGILYMMTLGSTPDFKTGFTAIDFTALQFAKAVFIALLISLVSSILPIISISRMPVKDVVLNKYEGKSKDRKKYKLIVGVIFAILVFIVPPRIKGPASMSLDVIIIILCAVAVILLVPYITNAFIKIFEKVYVFIFKNEGVLAAKNLRDNRTILNNITLLTIGVACIVMINTTSYSVITEMTNYFKNGLKYQLSYATPEVDKATEQRIRTVEGVEDTARVYIASNIEVDNFTIGIKEIQGENKYKYLNYYKMDFEGDPKSLLEELDTNRNIILSNMLKNRYSLKKGDTITLKLRDVKKKYKVTGFMDTLTWGGDYALISEKFFKQDIGTKDHTVIDIKASGDVPKLAEALKKKFARNKPVVTIIMDFANMTLNDFKRMYDIENGFSILTALIGIFGIFNNIIIGLIERRRSLAVLRSIGMSRKQVAKMLFVEALTVGLIGAIVGVLAGIIMSTVVPYLIISMGSPHIPLLFSRKMLGGALIIGVLVSVIASISPSVKSSKLNIVEAIKY